jgi:hypothetical protein
VGKSEIVEGFLSTLSPESRKEIEKRKEDVKGVKSYLAHTQIRDKYIDLIFEDTLCFDDPIMTGTYLKS